MMTIMHPAPCASNWKICCQPSPNSDLSNAFDEDYSAGQAVADLEKLMNEATLLELTHGPHSPRSIELQKLIPVQERLVRAKLDGDFRFIE